MPDRSDSGVDDLDINYMRRALALAERGRGRVSPNPLVGCVLVQGGRIVGQGWHSRAGAPHAEVEALRSAGADAAGATAYVTLEPCSHYGRTPPCTDALLAAGVTRVVVAALDPDPRVDGGGAEQLRRAGVTVVTGVLEAEAFRQNEVFRTNQLKRRPFVLYKSAMSLDGKSAVGAGPARWITGPESRRLVHEWRDEHAAIGVGVGTVLADDPSLTTRLPEGRTPIKVIFDSGLRTPPDARLFAPDDAGKAARVILVASDTQVAGNGDATRRARALRAAGAELLLVPGGGGRPELGPALERLLNLGVTSLLLEGGGTLAWSFLQARLIDRVAWFVAPTLIGGEGIPGPLAGAGALTMNDAVGLTEVSVATVGADLLVTGYPHYQAPTTRRSET